MYNTRSYILHACRCMRVIFYTSNFCQGINNHEWWIFLIRFFFKSLLCFEREGEWRWTGSMIKNLSYHVCIRGEILWWVWNFDRPSFNLAFFFFLFFSLSLSLSSPLSIFFHGWRPCIDHKRARTYIYLAKPGRKRNMFIKSWVARCTLDIFTKPA